MGIVVIGAVFVDIKGYPLSTYIPGGRNAGTQVIHLKKANLKCTSYKHI